MSDQDHIEEHVARLMITAQQFLDSADRVANSDHWPSDREMPLMYRLGMGQTYATLACAEALEGIRQQIANGLTTTSYQVIP